MWLAITPPGCAIVDNVPMVAAAMGMHDRAQHPQDSFLWEFLACCAGAITYLIQHRLFG